LPGFYTITAKAIDDVAGTSETVSGILLSSSAPVVLTLDIHSYEQNTVMADGEVIIDGGSEVTQRGMCWSLHTNPTIESQISIEGSGTGKFTSLVTGMIPGTKYYVRAYASNEVGTSYGDEVSFTFIGKPVVDLTNPTHVTNLTAYCGGGIVSDGGADIIDKGFFLDKTGNTLPDSSFIHQFISMGPGNKSYSRMLRGLSPGTEYYLWAYAINQVGVTYSEAVMFNTLPVEKGTLVDERDGREYQTIKLDDQWWMAENLNIGEMILSSKYQRNNSIIEKYCYDNNEDNCDIYGGLYQLREMMQYQAYDEKSVGTTRGICPTGWHLSTDLEWQKLEYKLGMDPADLDVHGERWTNSGMLKESGTSHWHSTNTNASNETGFTAMPGGFWYHNGWFGDEGQTAYFWDASSWYRRIYHNSEKIGRYGHDPFCAMSVRCVKN